MDIFFAGKLLWPSYDLYSFGAYLIFYATQFWFNLVLILASCKKIVPVLTLCSWMNLCGFAVWIFFIIECSRRDFEGKWIALATQGAMALVNLCAFDAGRSTVKLIKNEEVALPLTDEMVLKK